ncbi:MAG TPA: hypothetical protein PK680_06610 [Novosphingobium sp.]|nr:hypothetical protein [Novosphingobium sp.]HQA18040.1 hypothetical protein [Novosphingobium sp.]
MRYVFLAFAMAAAVMVWANVSEKGRSVKRHLSEHPTDARWSS